MKRKYIKFVILILVLLGLLIGYKMYKNADKVFNGGFVSSQWVEGGYNYSVSIDIEEGYSQEEVEFFTSIATKKRKEEISIGEASNLGNPTHGMRVFISEKSTGITKWVLDLNLWLKEDIGYIQPQERENLDMIQFPVLVNISKLDSEEHKFLVNALLKYHTTEEIFKN